MKTYKNLTISKLKDSLGGNKPTHTIVVADENYENKEYVGRLWTKEGQNGKFLSGKFQDKGEFITQEGKTIEVKGWVLVREDELEAFIAKADRKFTPEEKEKMTVDDIAMLEDLPF